MVELIYIFDTNELRFNITEEIANHFQEYNELTNKIIVNLNFKTFPLTFTETSNGIKYMIEFLKTECVNMSVIYDVMIITHVSLIKKNLYNKLFIYMCNEINKFSIFWEYEKGKTMRTMICDKAIYNGLERLYNKVDHNLNGKNNILDGVYTINETMFIEQKIYERNCYLFPAILLPIIFYNKRFLLRHNKYKYMMCMFENIPYIDIKNKLSEDQLKYLMEYLALKKLSFMNENFYNIKINKLNYKFIKNQMKKFNLNKATSLDANLLDTLKILDNCRT